jgi:transcriptional regulator with XRE-family HTH domain
MSTRNGIKSRMLPVQLRMARVALGLTVRATADVAGVSHDSITRMEAGDTLKPATIEKIRSALQAAGVEFIDENGGGPGVRLRGSKPESQSYGQS